MTTSFPYLVAGPLLFRTSSSSVKVVTGRKGGRFEIASIGILDVTRDMWNRQQLLVEELVFLKDAVSQPRHNTASNTLDAMEPTDQQT